MENYIKCNFDKEKTKVSFGLQSNTIVWERQQRQKKIKNKK